MIETIKINKYFGPDKILSDVSLKINSGEIVGFLGRNAAGKTTLMRIITTYLYPSSGRAIVNGFDTVKEPLNVKKSIGYLPETPPLYANMTVFDYLKFAAQMKGVPLNRRKIEVDKVIWECDIRDVKGKTIATLSKGFKQRVGIAQALLNSPKLIVLDEPTSGLDPLQVLHIRELIQKLKHQMTIILSTHILSEIEQIANRVVIIKKGAIVFDNPIDVVRQNGNSLEKLFLDLHEEEAA